MVSRVDCMVSRASFMTSRTRVRTEFSMQPKLYSKSIELRRCSNQPLYDVTFVSMTSFPALALLLQLCCAAKLITLVDDGSPRGRANGLLYHKTWALCCAPSFFMALTVFGALHVLLSETFTGAKNNPYPAEKASSWFHVQDWMRTWIVTCPIISIDVAQRLRSMLLFQARLGWLPSHKLSISSTVGS